MTVVIDASVTLKWLLEDPVREPDTKEATELLEAVASGILGVIQPIHWLVEVAAVLARLSPQTAADDVSMLAALQFPTFDEPHVMQRAVRLAIESGQHVFDTLYHAVALEADGAVLVTADDRYRTDTFRYGKVVALRDWTMAT